MKIYIIIITEDKMGKDVFRDSGVHIEKNSDHRNTVKYTDLNDGPRPIHTANKQRKKKLT